MSSRWFTRNAGILSFSLLVVLIALLAVDLILILLVQFLQHAAQDDLSTAPAVQLTVRPVSTP
jgi:hypothetical protein